MADLRYYNNNTSTWESIKVSTRLAHLLNTVVLTQDQNYCNIGITSFNPVEDVLLVFKNTTFLQKNVDYTVNGGLLRIETTNEEIWSNGTTFYFILFKNIDKDTVPSADGGLLQDGSVTIAKLATSLQNYINKIGTSTLETTTQNISDAINELVYSDNTIQAQLAEIAVNVKNFGAKGDGVTDDYLAIQAAIEVIRINGGGKLLFPFGTYRVTNTIGNSTQRIDNITILGDSATILGDIPSSAETMIIRLYGSNVLIEGIDFKWSHTFNVVNDTRNNSGSTIYIGGLVTDYTENISIRRCKFYGSWYAGVRPVFCKKLKIENCYFENCLATSIFPANIQNDLFILHNIINGSKDDGIFVACDSSVPNGTKNVIIEGNTLINCHTKAIGTSGVDGCIISKNIIDNTYSKAILVNNESGLMPSINVTISENIIKNAGKNYGIDKVHTTIASDAYGIQIANTTTNNVNICRNQIIDTALIAIVVYNGSNVSIDSNMIKNAGSSGISVGTDGAPDNLSVINCTISRNTLYNMYAYGIYITHSSYLNVNSNSIRGWKNGATTECGGLLFYWCDYALASGNFYKNDYSGNYSYKIAGTSSYVKISAESSDEISNYVGTLVQFGSRKITYNTAVPTTGANNQGDICFNYFPTEQGTSGSKYVLLGWQCISSGTPGTWRELRNLTGN